MTAEFFPRITRMIGSYRPTYQYQAEIEKAKSAIDCHTVSIAYLNATIMEKQKALQKREKLLEKAFKRLEIAERLLSEQNS